MRRAHQPPTTPRQRLAHRPQHAAPKADKAKAEEPKYAEAVDYLDKQGRLPPDSKGWVKAVKDEGNVVNHDLVLATQQQAEDVSDFTQALLVYMYELSAKAKARSQIPSPPP